MFSEVVLGGRLDSIAPMSEIDLVEIKIEDLLFSKGLLHAIGQNGLSNLSRPLSLGGEKEGSGNLLGNGTPSLDDFPGLDILPEGPEDSGVIEALMLKKTGILC